MSDTRFEESKNRVKLRIAKFQKRIRTEQDMGIKYSPPWAYMAEKAIDDYIQDIFFIFGYEAQSVDVSLEIQQIILTELRGCLNSIIDFDEKEFPNTIIYKKYFSKKLEYFSDFFKAKQDQKDIPSQYQDSSHYDPHNYVIRYRCDSRSWEEICREGFNVRVPLSGSSEECIPFNSPTCYAVSSSQKYTVCPIFPLFEKSGSQKHITLYTILANEKDKSFCRFYQKSLSAIHMDCVSMMYSMEYVKEDTFLASIPPHRILTATPIERWNDSGPLDQIGEMERYVYTSAKITGQTIINTQAICFTNGMLSLLRPKVADLKAKFDHLIESPFILDRPEMYPLEKKYQIACQHAFFIDNRFQQNELKTVKAKEIYFASPNKKFFKEQHINQSGVMFFSKSKLEKENEKFFDAVTTTSTFSSHIESEKPKLMSFVHASQDKLGIGRNFDLSKKDGEFLEKSQKVEIG